MLYNLKLISLFYSAVNITVNIAAAAYSSETHLAGVSET